MGVWMWVYVDVWVCGYMWMCGYVCGCECMGMGVSGWVYGVYVCKNQSLMHHSLAACMCCTCVGKVSVCHMYVCPLALCLEREALTVA